MFQDIILLIHGFIFVFVYCIKDDSIYDDKTRKRLTIATWIIGVPYIIFLTIMSVYLSQYNY